MKRLPSAREIEASRDIRNVVFSDGIARLVAYELQPDGLWAAGLVDDPELGWLGSGVTPISAIVDLIEQVMEV